MSRPIQSGEQNKLRSSIDAGRAKEEASLVATPRMILDRTERTHVFQDVPDDIRIHINACFLRGETPYETANIYGVLARVSHAHRAEVASLLRAPGNEDVHAASAANALSNLPSLKWDKHREKKLTERVDALLECMTLVQLPLASIDSTTVLNVILSRALALPLLKRVVLDFSANASLWKRKMASEIKKFNVSGDWERQREIFKNLVKTPMPVQRQIKIDLILRNRVVEPLYFDFLVTEGAGLLPCLRVLDLNGLGFSRRGIHDAASLKQLGRLISMATSLEELHLGDSIIDSRMLEILSQGLKEHPSLRIVSLKNNMLCFDYLSVQISLKGWASLMQVLPDMPKLALLDLRGNLLGNIDADDLLDALNSSVTIERVMLSQNKISKLHLIWLDNRVSKF